MALAHLISNVRAAGISFDDDDPVEALVGREVSELELLTLRRRTEEQRKARYHWSLLRDSIRNVRKAVEQADTRDITLVHGIHHDRKLNHTYNIQHAIFIPQRKVSGTSVGAELTHSLIGSFPHRSTAWWLAESITVTIRHSVLGENAAFM